MRLIMHNIASDAIETKEADLADTDTEQDAEDSVRQFMDDNARRGQDFKGAYPEHTVYINCQESLGRTLILLPTLDVPWHTPKSL